MGFFDFLGYGGGDPTGHDRRSLQGLGENEQTMGQRGQDAFEGQDRAGLNGVYDSMGQTQNYLRGQMQGQNSVSALQLQQANQQQLASQRSFAAGANPNDAAMAARNASQNIMRAQMGLAGQQATAGLQERNMAASQLGQQQLGMGQLQLQRSGQDLQASLGGYGAANNAYGQSIAHPQKTWGDFIKSSAGGAAGGVSALGGIGAIGGMLGLGGGSDPSTDTGGDLGNGDSSGPITSPGQDDGPVTSPDQVGDIGGEYPGGQYG